MRLLSILFVVFVLFALTTTVEARPCTSCEVGVCAVADGPVAAVAKAPVRVAVKAAVLPVRAVKAVLERTRARKHKPVRRILGRVFRRRCN